jgi:hypothetical protein
MRNPFSKDKARKQKAKRDFVDRLLQQETGMPGKDRMRNEAKRIKKGK